jgi:hypothetical protein
VGKVKAKVHGTRRKFIPVDRVGRRDVGQFNQGLNVEEFLFLHIVKDNLEMNCTSSSLWQQVTAARLPPSKPQCTSIIALFPLGYKLVASYKIEV